MGETILRHLWCCVAQNRPVCACIGTPCITVSRAEVVAALRATPAHYRHAAYAFARVGPFQHRPYTSWRTLAFQRRCSVLWLRQMAEAGADLFFDILVREAAP